MNFFILLKNVTDKSSKKDEENNGIKNKAQPRWITELMEAEREAARAPRRVFLNLNNEPEELKAIMEHGNTGESTPAPSGSSSVPNAKGQRGRKRKAGSEPEDLKIPAQHMVSDANNKDDRRLKPIWFSLEAYPW